ncbi:hypothetical protein RDI58_020258 [Solanum bulbocastanum]|uniref:Protein FAR1-RELATED SEQUENCE n=1 Tax=Solanum bulbocastanum TaxID=147425 RepID=A0AAN8TC53_SOLBU
MQVLLYMSKKEEGNWVVCRHVAEHNHELASPNSQNFLNLIDLLDNSRVRPSKIASVLINQAGSVDRLNLTSQDIQNYLQTRRQKDLEKGDVQLMLQYFQTRQSENPELDELPYESEEDCVVSSGQGSEKYCEIISCEQSQDTTLLDPPVAAIKGHPRSLRMKGALEVTQKTKKVTSQKQKRQTSNYNVEAEQNEYYQGFIENSTDCAYATSFTEWLKAASTPFQQHHPS